MTNSINMNEKRRIILKKIDNKQDVSIMELGMYELTPYYQEDY